jgi:hypothetical protein
MPLRDLVEHERGILNVMKQVKTISKSNSDNDDEDEELYIASPLTKKPRTAAKLTVEDVIRIY